MQSRRSRPPTSKAESDAPNSNSAGAAAAVESFPGDIDPDAFVAAVQPAIERCDARGLLEFLKSRWTGQQIINIIKGPHADARKVAALCLSLVGCRECVPAITGLLKDPDPCVNELAEHALWSIWFRCGSDPANENLARGAKALSDRNFDKAIAHFDRAIELSPDCAEPYNQRAIAKHLMEQYEDSIQDCRRAVERMPCHFGAWAGMGHNYAHLGDLNQAIEAYDRALDINPRMTDIRQALAELRSRI
jgi:tetratricopeptide (TPR) repeat protein